MIVTLAQIFDKHFLGVKFNNKLAKLLYGYQLDYINQNKEYLEFYGGNLLGVQVIRFKDSDVIKLFDNVLSVDYFALEEDFNTVTTINLTYKISGDLFNQTIMYLLHRFLISKELTDNEKNRALYDIALIFFYRCIAALSSYYFRYPADPKIAQAAYAKLSNKFIIKQLGSWNKVMDYRAKALIDKQGIHYKNLIKFNDDDTIVYAINDSQGRIRDLVKNYYREFNKVHVSGDGVGTTSSVVKNEDGEDSIKEKTKSVEAYDVYMQNAIIDKNTFINNELITLISKINSNSSFRIIKHTLEWMFENHSNIIHNKLIHEFMHLVIIHSFYLIQNNIGISHLNDYQHILGNLKNLYLSTRSNDKDLLRIREIGEKIVLLANAKANKGLVSSTRTSIILYIVLRALVGRSRNNV